MLIGADLRACQLISIEEFKTINPDIVRNTPVCGVNYITRQWIFKKLGEDI
jgi:hypothetical protein